MSIVGIFTKSRPQIGNLVFDATLNENTELATTVTRFPVEAGFTGTDHAVQEPLRITMTVGVSDNAFIQLAEDLPDIDELQRKNADKLQSQTGGALKNFGNRVQSNIEDKFSAGFSAGQAKTRSQQALDDLRDLQKRNIALTVITLKKAYKNCLIASTRQETNRENENALEIVVEFVQLVTVGSPTGGTPTLPRNDPAATQGQLLQPLGLVSPK